MDSERHQLLAEKVDLEAMLREHSAAWTQLHGALHKSGDHTSPPSHVVGREAEVRALEQP